jgi:hypothetical protein
MSSRRWQTARVNDYGRDVYLDAEATALSLKALANQSGSSLLPKAARWLVKNRRKVLLAVNEGDRFAIYGLTDYLKVSKELSPDYSFEVYLNGEKVAASMSAQMMRRTPTISLRRKANLALQIRFASSSTARARFTFRPLLSTSPPMKTCRRIRREV